MISENQANQSKKAIDDNELTKAASQLDNLSSDELTANLNIDEKRVKDDLAKLQSEIGKEQEKIHLIKWQNRLLPLMSILLICLTIFFLVASIFQLYALQSNIMLNQQPDLNSELKALNPVNGELPTNTFEKARLAALIQLEANSVQRRYHQAATATLARVWTIYLGFLTGMILSLVGAAFILGKLHEGVSRLNFENQGLKAALESTSPGIILVCLGTALMVVTMLARADVSVEDRPLYITGVDMFTRNESDTSNNEDNKNTKEKASSTQNNTSSNSNLENSLKRGKNNLDKISVTPTPQ